MANIHIERKHDLGLQGARSTVEQVAETLKQELQAECEWSGDKLLFQRTGASGTIEAKEHSIDLDIELDMVLSMMKSVIEERINLKLDTLLS